MPPAIGAVAAGVMGGFSITAAGTLAFSFSSALLAGVSSLVLSGLSSALQPKQKAVGDLSASVKGGDITRQVRQPMTARRTVYGEVRCSGPYAFMGGSGSNYYFHFVLLLASHEIQSIDEIWVGDESITPDMIDGSGAITSGKYANRMIVKKYLGTDGQTAEPNLTGNFAEWDANCRLQRIAYLYVRLQYDRNVFASGIPNVSAWIKGKKVDDPRTGNSSWTHNAALIARDYMTDSRLGVGIDGTNIDDTFTNSAANTCEEFVTTTDLPFTVSAVDTTKDLLSISGETLELQTGDRVQVTSTGSIPSGISALTDYYVIVYKRSGTPKIKLATSYANALSGTAMNITSAGSGTITVTKKAEPRYSGGGYIDADAEPQAALTDILSAMSGKAIYSGGKWRLKAGAYETPTIEFNEDDLAGPITIKTKTSRKDRFNRIQGTYVSPLNNGQPSGYPRVKNDTYATEDGKEIEKGDFDLNFTQRPHTGQRLAKIALESSRQEIVFMAKFKLSAFKVQIGDNCLISNDRYGWSAKPFEVVEWALNIDEIDDVPTPVIEITLKETASTIYDWNNGEETSVDPAPNTNLPDAFTVEAVTGLRFDSFPVTTTGGDVIYRIVLSWDAHSNAFVVEDGHFELQYKKTSEAEYKPSFFVDGSLTTSELTQGSIDTSYDLRIRAVNNLGVYSNWNTLSGVTPGSSGGVTETDDYGAYVADAVTITDDWGAYVSDPVGTSDDYGGFV